MSEPSLNADAAMQQIDTLLSHVWMVRTFLKHSEEAEEDDELAEAHRGLYDFMLALGGPLKNADAAGYLKTCRKKWAKFSRSVELFLEIQPEISGHTNFNMAAVSLREATRRIRQVLDNTAP